MSDTLANDVRKQYDFAFATLRGIAEAFPEDKWLVPHGDEYYIPSRIAYHLAVFIGSLIAGGYKDPEYNAKLPFGSWMKGTPETLPDRKAFLAYLDEVTSKAQEALAKIDDSSLSGPIEPDMPPFAATQIGKHLLFMRELSAHTGELNKMLIENGLDDVWISR